MSTCSSANGQESITEKTYEELAARIISGELGANVRLNEAKLVREFGYSRGVIREAITRLAADHLVVNHHNKGAYVRPITRREVYEFLQLRAIIEAFAARRAAERINELGVRESVLEMVRECNSLRRAPSNEGMIEHDSRFHRAILSWSGNAVLEEEWLRIRRSRHRRNFLRSLSVEEIAVSIEGHLAILNAIIAGNAAEAEKLSNEHVHLANSRLQKMLNDEFERIHINTSYIVRA